MNKARLAETIAEKTGLSKKQADDFIEKFVDTITQTLVSGDDVTIAGFGTFMPKFRSARMGVNPQNPSERIQIPAVVIPKFKAGKGLKDALKAVSTDSVELDSSDTAPSANESSNADSENSAGSAE